MSLKIHNFLISYPILLKLFFIGLSDFSGSIESKLFLEWTWALAYLFDWLFNFCILYTVISYFVEIKFKFNFPSACVWKLKMIIFKLE